jgi:hypothetical protein
MRTELRPNVDNGPGFGSFVALSVLRIKLPAGLTARSPWVWAAVWFR